MNLWVRFLDAVDTSLRAARHRWRTTPLPRRRSWQTVAGSAAVGLTVAVTAVAATGPWDSGQRTAERAWAADREADSGQDHIDDGRPGPRPDTRPRASAPPVLGSLDEGGKAPSDKGLGKALKPLLKSSALGTQTTVSVGDALSGEELYAAKGGDAIVPASTIKIATAAAALTALGPEHRIATRAVWDGQNKRVVLVGGGDPTLTEKQLASLAKATVRSVRNRELKPKTLGYDTSRYPGPRQHPIGVNDNIAPLTPLMLNAARVDDSTKGPAPRAVDPSADAAVRFAELLRDRGVDTQRTVAAQAPKGWADKITDATEDSGDGKDGKEGKDGDDTPLLGTHHSAPLATLVERMLLHSDNDIAEALARQTALATDRKADFDGAEKAVKSQLEKLDLPMKGTRFADGSGLSRSDRVSATFLTTLLARAAEPDHAELRPLLTGLPVAGFNGTLGGRYGTPESAQGAGLVRAKTGTLTGVNSLAGTVVDAEGRLLTFALFTTGARDPKAAQNSLDALASKLAGCGCR